MRARLRGRAGGPSEHVRRGPRGNAPPHASTLTLGHGSKWPATLNRGFSPDRPLPAPTARAPHEPVPFSNGGRRVKEVCRAVAPLAASLLLVTMPAACASAPPMSSAPSAAAVQVSERLFFGRSIPGGGLVSDEDWSRFLRDVITPRFPQGWTVWEAEGQWLEAAGVLAREAVIVVEIIHSPGANLESSLEQISQEYKRRFRQEAVLRVTSAVQRRMYDEQ
jgi:hypothetical protein